MSGPAATAGAGTSSPLPARVELVVLGVGAGATTVYTGQPSSSYVILIDGKPELLLDAVSYICYLSVAWSS